MLLRGGVFCGIALFAASAAQQIGIGTTSTAKAGFLTALYVVLVPLLGVFFGRQPGSNWEFAPASAWRGFTCCAWRGTIP